MKKWGLVLLTLLVPVVAWAGFQGYSDTTSLGLFNKITCSTGITCTSVNGKMVMVSSPTLAGSVALTAANAADVYLNLAADNSDDNGDDWRIVSQASGNALVFQNDTSGTLATKFSLSTAGLATFTAGLTLSDAEVISNPSDDLVRVASDDASMILDVYSPLATNGDAILRLSADASADNGDDWQIKHTGSTNALEIMNDASGSQVSKFTVAAADGDVTGPGTGEMSGFLQKQVASTTVAITAAQCGSTFVSDSADVMVLPEASTVLGCRLTFVCGTADNLDIDPADGTDQIGPALNSVAGGTGAAITPAAGDAIRCTDIGSSIILEAVEANLWAPIGVGNGAWTDIN